MVAPDSFMKVWGTARASRRSPTRTSVVREREARVSESRPAWRVANRVTASAPTLCRECRYSVPGLPSPTASRSAAVPLRAWVANRSG